MEKVIDCLELISMDLLRLSSLCNVLSCAEGEHSRPRYSDVLDSFAAIRDMLDSKVEEINRVVKEYCESQSGAPAEKP